MKIQALKGMRDLLPAEQALRDYIQGQILATYRASGFERISTRPEGRNSPVSSRKSTLR